MSLEFEPMAANRGLKPREKSVFFLPFVPVLRFPASGDCVSVYWVFRGSWVLGFLGSERGLRGFVRVSNRDFGFWVLRVQNGRKSKREKWPGLVFEKGSPGHRGCKGSSLLLFLFRGWNTRVESGRGFGFLFLSKIAGVGSVFGEGFCRAKYGGLWG